jgi:hypothetical protein
MRSRWCDEKNFTNSTAKPDGFIFRVAVSASLFAITTLAFASPRQCRFSPDDYHFHPFGWRTFDEGLIAEGPVSGDAELAKAPICRQVAMEADVLVERSLTEDDWGVAGVGILLDPENFWHVALVVPPKSAARQNFVELSEMRDGIWNSQGNLKLLAEETSRDVWKIGQRYRLRIAMTPETIEGSVYNAAGQLVARKVFSLTGAAAVAGGRPMLRSRGLTARFTAINPSWDQATACAEDRTKPPIYLSKSLVADVKCEATGFFRVERRDGKWWSFDPLGRGFVPLGVDHVRYTGHWCESLGYAPYHRRMRQLYPHRADWTRETVARLSSWGFNRLGGHAWEPLVHQGLCYSKFVGIGTPMAALGDEFDITRNEGRPCTAFPNVFHPRFEEYCRYQAARICRPRVADPWLFGYFLDNELAWWGRGGLETGLFDAVMKKNADHSAKIALRDFLANRYGWKVESLNSAWGTDLPSLDDILARAELFGTHTEKVRTDKAAFLALVAERYFSHTTKAIRAVDPNHMILGCRFAGGRAAADVWAAAAKYCDVLSLNYYGNVDLDRGIAIDDDHSCQGLPLGVPFTEFAKHARGKPLLVTEWSFIALDSGLPCTNGAGQRFRTQAERARAAGIFAETLLRMPDVIGFDYFMWCDEPAQGISAAFPENSNYGLVNGDNEVYEDLVESMSGVLKRAGDLHREGPRPIPNQFASQRKLPTPAELLDRFSGSGVGDDSALRFHRTASQFTVENGHLTLRGAIGPGPVFHSIQLGELELGQYVNVAHQLAGRHEWPRTSQVAKATATETGSRIVVELVNRLPAVSQDSRQRPFEIVQRIHVLPETDWFAVELVSYRNLAETPVELGGVYFQLFSAIGGDAQHDQPASAQWAPRLWGRCPGDAWIDCSASAFVGMTAPHGAPLKARFWLNEHGGQHPDAHWPLGGSLSAGETLRPEEPIYWIVVAGRGSKGANWNQLEQLFHEAADEFR